MAQRWLLAINIRMACGAEVILIQNKVDFDKDVLRVIWNGRNIGKSHFVVVVAEGAGSALEIATRIQDLTGIDSRATVLGHLQRGGSPTLRDRLMASNMGIKAIECINSGRYNRVISYQDGNICDFDIEEALGMTKTITENMINNAHMIAM